MPSDGARDGEVEFTSAGAARVMERTCRAAGLDSSSAELIRFGENALFRLSVHPVIVRIARPDYLASVRNEVQVSRWLEREGVPALDGETGHGDGGFQLAVEELALREDHAAEAEGAGVLGVGEADGPFGELDCFLATLEIAEAVAELADEFGLVHVRQPVGVVSRIGALEVALSVVHGAHSAFAVSCGRQGAGLVGVEQRHGAGRRAALPALDGCAGRSYGARYLAEVVGLVAHVREDAGAHHAVVHDLGEAEGAE